MGSSHPRGHGGMPRLVFALVEPLQAFFRTEATAGRALMVCATAAMLLANSRFSGAYFRATRCPVGLVVGERTFAWSFEHLVNDGLMTLFFFVAGMEIKRELTRGELRDPRSAALPVVAAVGGMVVPALLYAGIAAGSAATRGWGIPMATDIAFSLGVLAMVRTRVPMSLVAFLTALAIFDDLGAIVVIAVFYGKSVSVPALAAAAGILVVMGVCARARVQATLPWALLGVALWLSLLPSGIHATMAGVCLGLAVPSTPRRPTGEVLDELELALDDLRVLAGARSPDSSALSAVERHLEAMQSPLDRFLHNLHGPVAFVVLPLFALVNAGVAVGPSPAALAEPATLGVIVGLLVGKPLGVFGATWLAVRTRLAPMPTGANWAQVFGVAALAGIGFTMSLFVDQLAFADAPVSAAAAKLGVVVGSLASALVGIAVLRRGAERSSPTG